MGPAGMASPEVARALAEERARVARVLHDRVVQQLTVAVLRAGMLRARDLDPGTAAQVAQLESTLAGAVAELRAVLAELSAPPPAPRSVT